MPSNMLNPAYAAKAAADFDAVPARGPYTLAMSSTALFISLPNVTADYMDIVNRIRNAVENGSSTSYLPAYSDPTLIAGYKRQLSVLADFLSNPEAPSVEVPFATGTAMRPIILHPLSRGTVRLNVTDPLAQPLLDYRAGSNPIDFDINIAHLKWLRKVIDTPTLQKYGAVEVTPDPSIQSDEDLKAYVKDSMVLSHMHPCCTAAMMPKSLGGVVGPDLKVHGAAGLRVVDISILPFLPSAHTSTTAYAIGEKVSMLGEDQGRFADLDRLRILSLEAGVDDRRYVHDMDWIHSHCVIRAIWIVPVAVMQKANRYVAAQRCAVSASRYMVLRLPQHPLAQKPHVVVSYDTWTVLLRPGGPFDVTRVQITIP
jgi:hypothetical protein